MMDAVYSFDFFPVPYTISESKAMVNILLIGQ